MDDDEKKRISHATLLSEIHKVDDIAEKHAQIIIAISAALVAFASAHWAAKMVVTLVAAFGILVCVEWIFKITRHREIFQTCYEKLVAVERQIGINALRPPPKRLWNSISRDGFTILIWFAGVLVLLWLLILAGALLGFLK